MSSRAATGPWPALPLADWKDTYRTLHMWTQIVGKVQLALTPRTNHWWNVALHVTARGLTTGPMPVGPDVFTVAFDFVDQVLRIDLSRGERREIPLAPQPVAHFYEQLLGFRIGDFEKVLVFYRQLPKGIEILRVLHGARNIEAMFRRRGEFE